MKRWSLKKALPLFYLNLFPNTFIRNKDPFLLNMATLLFEKKDSVSLNEFSNPVYISSNSSGFCSIIFDAKQSAA